MMSDSFDCLLFKRRDGGLLLGKSDSSLESILQERCELINGFLKFKL